MNTKRIGQPTACPKCGKAYANKGIAMNHAKSCDGKQSGAPRSAAPISAEALDAVVRAMQDGMPLDLACNSVALDPDPFYASIKRVRLRDPLATEQDRNVNTRTKQAEAVFLRDLMLKLSNPGEEKNAVAAAKALYDSVKDRLKKQNLGLQYDCAILFPIVKRHVDEETYRAILSEVCELDPQLSVQVLDDRLLS